MMLEEHDGVMVRDGKVGASDNDPGGVDSAIERSVEFFNTGNVDSEEMLLSIKGVERVSTDGDCVRLLFKEKRLSEEVLDQGYVMIGGERMVVGQVGQLGWAELEVTGGRDVVGPEKLLELLESAGVFPVLDIQTQGGGMFGVVLENAKCKKLIKRGKLRLDGGIMLRVVTGEKPQQLDLEKGEEMAGKMMGPSEGKVVDKMVGDYLNKGENNDPAGLGYGCKPTYVEKDKNNNKDQSIDLNSHKDLSTDLEKVDDRSPTNVPQDDKQRMKMDELMERELLKYYEELEQTPKRTKEEGYRSLGSSTSGGLLDKEKGYRSFGSSTSGGLLDKEILSHNDGEEVDLLCNQKKENLIEVVKMSLTPIRNHNVSIVEKPNDVEIEDSSLGSSSSGSLSYGTSSSTDEEECLANQEDQTRRDNSSIQVVRMSLVPSDNVK